MKTRQEKAGPFGKLVKTVSGIFPENHLIQTSKYEIRSEKIPEAFDGFRIVHLSDLHGCSFGRDNSRLLSAVDAASPDAVVMTGDTADRQTENYGGLFRFAKALCGKYPVYAILGNHEQDLAVWKRKVLLNGMRARGVRILDNGSACLKQGGETVMLYGYRLPLRYYRADHRGKPRPELKSIDLERALGTMCGAEEYSILLAHNPLFFDVYAAWGADLTLCGHIHGGMIRLPHFGALLSPERNFFPHYSEGIYTSEKFPDRKMIVSRGLGSGARIHNLPEIVVLVLRRAPNGGTAEPEKGF